MSEYSTLSKLDAPELLFIERQQEQLAEANGAISACIELLEMFISDDDGENQIPEKAKTNYIRSGLMRAIRIANNDACLVADAMENQIRIARK